MIRGLYNGAAAMDVLSQQQNIISSNLANLTSPGHRRARLGVKMQPQGDLSTGLHHELGPKVDREVLDFSEGRMEQTGRNLDAAISGDGFFVLQGEQGNMYTRAGRFYRNPESGELVNHDGFRVLGEEGPITIAPDIGDRDITITSAGEIKAGDQTLGKLQVVSFQDNNNLVPVSHSVFMEGENSVVAEKLALVHQFQQEQSNSHPVSELTQLIIGTRQYEAVQKAVSAISEAIQEHINA